jgi:hypothetical protein
MIINSNLNFYIGINGDVKYLSIPGKPGISPASIITNSDRGNAIDNIKRFPIIDVQI